MSLYKYLEPKWAEAMVTRGAIRIGTLFDYRRQEEHGDERGDRHEGVRITLTDGRAKSVRGSEAPAFLRQALRIPKNVTLQFPEGAVIRVEATVPDMYVYCTCSRFSPELLTVFGGACVEITEADRFFDAVTRALSGEDECGLQRVTGFQLAPCEYRERAETWPQDTGYHPVFRKPPQYAHQSEVRAVWKTPCLQIQPVNLVVPDICSCCRRIA